MFEGLAEGFAIAVTPHNLLFAFLGVLVGQIVGALPGIGPSAAMALLLPVTFGMTSTSAIIMLAGIMYGGMYGGTLTSVLINVPGEAASVMTAVDGYQMARQGRAGPALAIAAIGSFVAGTASVVAVMLIAPPLGEFALSFSSPEYFLLALLGLTATASLGAKSPSKALLMAAAGLALATIGADPVLGADRFTFGTAELLDGLEFLPVAIGLFGIAEILASLEQLTSLVPIRTRLRDMWPKASDLAASRWPIVRGSAIGFLIGVMPGAGPTIAAFMAYLTEKHLSKHPERFGRGAIEGLAAAESANNSAVTGALVPLLTLGLPGSASTAILLAAFILHGIRPGPLLLEQQPQLVWALIASMYVGNVFLVIMNLPLAPAFAALLRVPYSYLAPAILTFSLVGAFAVQNTAYDVGIAVAFGVAGYLMLKADLPRAPLVLALVLGPIIEASLLQSLTLSLGSPRIFVERPIAAVLVVAVAASLLWPLAQSILRLRKAGAP